MKTKDEYMTISVFKCRECNGTGKVRNADFERCNINNDLFKNGCGHCPWRISCNWGEFVDCECCDNIGHLSVDHELFQPYGIRLLKKRKE